MGGSLRFRLRVAGCGCGARSGPPRRRVVGVAQSRCRLRSRRRSVERDFRSGGEQSSTSVSTQFRASSGPAASSGSPRAYATPGLVAVWSVPTCRRRGCDLLTRPGVPRALRHRHSTPTWVEIRLALLAWSSLRVARWRTRPACGSRPRFRAGAGDGSVNTCLRRNAFAGGSRFRRRARVSRRAPTSGRGLWRARWRTCGLRCRVARGSVSTPRSAAERSPAG